MRLSKSLINARDKERSERRKPFIYIGYRGWCVLPSNDNNKNDIAAEFARRLKEKDAR